MPTPIEPVPGLVIVNITCDPNRDPPQIIISFAGGFSSELPKPLYDAVREPLGLPDVVCG